MAEMIVVGTDDDRLVRQLALTVQDTDHVFQHGRGRSDDRRYSIG